MVELDQVGHTTRGRNLWHSASRQSLTLSAQLPLPEAWIRYDICVVVALAIRRQGLLIFRALHSYSVTGSECGIGHVATWWLILDDFENRFYRPSGTRGRKHATPSQTAKRFRRPECACTHPLVGTNGQVLGPETSSAAWLSICPGCVREHNSRRPYVRRPRGDDRGLRPAP